MLTKTQIIEIREHLRNASSPLFYFDNDQDGFSSYLLLRRMIKKGAGIQVKTSPLNMAYYNRIREFNPDVVFILDQPTVDNEFFEALEKDGIKVVWIDHHENNIEKIPKYVHYYNPLYNENKVNIPVTALAYQIAANKNDIWLAVLGCISDKFMPEFYSEFLEKYPDLGIKTEEPFEIYYNSTIGKISRMIGIGLKDRTTNVVKMMRFMYTIKTPYEILEENKFNSTIHKRFDVVDLKFKKYINRAKEEISKDDSVIFFKYAGETSMSADLANKLSYLYPDKFLIVGFIKGNRINLSMRGFGVKKIALEAIKEFAMGTCGGHDNAVGGQLNADEVEKFVENFKEILSKK